LYLMGCLADRGRDRETRLALREAATPEQARRVMAAALPPALVQALEPEALDQAYRRLQSTAGPIQAVRLTAADWQGACGVFLLVFLSTLPVALPFVFVRNVPAAMRLSNTVAILMLFAAGYAYGRFVGGRPVAWGVSMVLLGAALVALTIALGG
jgi:VIT1/CCC1 family predicted Fe2+/Mn2+ transporter